MGTKILCFSSIIWYLNLLAFNYTSNSKLFSGITLLFTVILLANPSILTVISLTGLALTLADYFMPLILQSIFKPEMWSGDKQKEFEEICTNIILYKTKAELLLSSYSRMRVTNSKLVSIILRFIHCRFIDLLNISVFWHNYTGFNFFCLDWKYR